ncbi:Transposase [Bacillus wiedmannii]|nr:Transposase [Bacillus wiedmannii]
MNIRLKPNRFEAVNDGRKSHRYERKTVFDILGVVYNCTMPDNQAA